MGLSRATASHSDVRLPITIRFSSALAHGEHGWWIAEQGATGDGVGGVRREAQHPGALYVGQNPGQAGRHQPPGSPPDRAFPRLSRGRPARNPEVRPDFCPSYSWRWRGATGRPLANVGVAAQPHAGETPWLLSALAGIAVGVVW